MHILCGRKKKKITCKCVNSKYIRCLLECIIPNFFPCFFYPYICCTNSSNLCFMITLTLFRGVRKTVSVSAFSVFRLSKWYRPWRYPFSNRGVKIASYRRTFCLHSLYKHCGWFVLIVSDSRHICDRHIKYLSFFRNFINGVLA